MSAGIPLFESWQLQRNSTKKAYQDADRNYFHIPAEFPDDFFVGDAVVAVKLHFFPYGQDSQSNEEYLVLILPSVASIR